MSTIDARKKLGRPKVDTQEVSVRMDRELLDRVDTFAAGQGIKGRPEAVRRLTRLALDTLQPSPDPSPAD
ncbi:MAG: ribbon-helix-helix protein, CopG family [Proteobacteria bacterium]|nr:ribbon-helix-helix protein, CopG family [Pseudomonadota bacterium]